MKTYPTTDLTGDRYLNPDWPGHTRDVSSITSISIHHNAAQRPHDYDSVAQYTREAAQHYDRLGPGLQYHYCIDNVGEIFHVRPITTWLHAVGSTENTSMIAICLDGNFENQQPTREQCEALFQLLTELCTQHPEFPATWPDVRPHADYSATACCGANLRGYIYGIKDEATARAYPDVPYDWPEYQPSATAPVAPIPASLPNTLPTPPVPTTNPTPTPANQDHEARLSHLESLVALILGFLGRWKTFIKYKNKR